MFLYFPGNYLHKADFDLIGLHNNNSVFISRIKRSYVISGIQ